MTTRQRGRRPRLSDAETSARMLTAALEALVDQGVTVGLDGLHFEDVIRRADVSRTSAYRRWPTREAFLADVLLEVARGAELPGVGARVGQEGGAVLARREAELQTAAGRHDLFVELLRLSFQVDLEATLASPAFQTYLVLRAAFVGVPDPGLRTELAAVLAHSERRAVARGAAILAGAAHLLGLRPRPPLAGPDGFQVLARAVSAATTGFVVAALADPTLVHATRRLAPFGSSREAKWSMPALTLAGVVLAHLEDDPHAPVPSAALLRDALPGLVEQGAAAAATAD